MLNRGAHEGGFTLIEVLVAMMLLMVVVGGVVFSVAQLGRGNSSLAANRGAQRDALEAMEQMRHDIAASRSPALEQFNDRREVLRDLMYFRSDSQAPSSDDPARALCGGARRVPYIECLQGITWATPTSIWFRADIDNVDPAPADCVGYVVSGTTLRRYQSNRWRDCRPALMSSSTTRQTTLLEASQLRSLGTQGIFSYTMRYHPSMRPNVVSSPTGCRTFTRSGRQVSSFERSFINAINVDLGGVATNRRDVALAGLATSSAVTAHVAGDYAYASGCAG